VHNMYYWHWRCDISWFTIPINTDPKERWLSSLMPFEIKCWEKVPDNDRYRDYMHTSTYCHLNLKCRDVSSLTYHRALFSGCATVCLLHQLCYCNLLSFDYCGDSRMLQMNFTWCPWVIYYHCTIPTQTNLKKRQTRNINWDQLWSISVH
jgi:hypothetical protein